MVFNIPSIWTSFHVSQDVDPRTLKAGLLRSRGLRFDIHVVDEATELKTAREQLNTLTQHPALWKNVEISHPEALALLEKSIPLLLSNLQSLTVKTGSQQLSPVLMSLYEPFPEYPPPPDVSLEWKNRMYPSLRCLDLCDIQLKPRETEQFLGFLEAHSTLEKLALTDIWELDAYIPSRTVVLPHIKELQLRGIPSSEILQWVNAPSLQKLMVELSSRLRLWTTVNIESNYATTTNATLVRFSTTPDALLNVLSAVPFASEVELISTDLRSRNSFHTESILIEHKLLRLTSLHIQGVISLLRLKAVVEAYRQTMTEVKVHCLDLGLPEDSFLEDYSERDEALA
ncbi:hypothetical protein FS837_004346 [Tulasnella sp. UAMH 9824]|nr:hypothetical protein FS837_004346 [Tulasnella sp. UAMH 9824]